LAPAPWPVAFFAGIGAAFIIAGAAVRSPERTRCGGVYAALGLILFWCRIGNPTVAADLLAIVAIPASLRLARQLAGETPLLPMGRGPLVSAAVASLWLWVTRWTLAHGHAGHLTTAWAILALVIFAAGLGLRERIYRLGGFAVLTLAVGRLFVLDVWRFDTLPRIVSFLVLGGVLLTLSFVYHRFADAMRRWL
jgi:hypothetical protein